MAEPVNTEKQFSIQKIYTKDLSFETPNSPAIFTEKWEPAVDFNLGTHVTTVQDGGFYEVTLTATLTVKVAEKIAYLVEVKQSGVFALTGFDDQELGPMLGSFCPNILFPYARETVSDLVTRGGFPQLLLAPVNFDVLYAQHMQQQSAEQAQAKPTLN